MEKYLEINYNSPIKIIVKNQNILSYIKQVLEDNFKFKIVVEEYDFNNNNTTLELSQDISLEVFNRHFNLITEDVLREHSK